MQPIGIITETPLAISQPGKKQAPKPSSLFPQFFTVFTALLDGYRDLAPEVDEALEHIRHDFFDRWTEMKSWTSFEGKEPTIKTWLESDTSYQSLFADSNAFLCLKRTYDEVLSSELASDDNPQRVLVEA
jgi:hypothetical protein